jgi:surface protein
MRARTADARTCCAHVRVRVNAGFGAHASAPQPCHALSIRADRLRLGAQVFQSATAFNANIGAWNTASVTTLQMVCTAVG